MRLTVLGATGRTGLPLLEQALAAGYEITAFVRDPSRLALKHDRLSVVQGDVADAARIEEAVKGVDAVISVLGPTKTSGPDMYTTAMRNVVAAMKKHGVRRLITLTGAGVRFPGDKPGLMDHVMKGLLTIASGRVLRDSEGHAEVVKSSGLDWTIIRVPMLNDGPHTGQYSVGKVGDGVGIRIARADVADFLLKQVTDTTYVGQAPMIGSK